MTEESNSIQTIEHQVALLLRRVEATRKQSVQLDRSSYLLLDALSTGGPLTISALAQQFQLDISTLSRQTAPLEASGWVERLADQTDGRVKALQLTPAGRAELDAARSTRYTIYADLLQDWPEQDRATFATLLTRFNRTISERRPLTQRPSTPNE